MAIAVLLGGIADNLDDCLENTEKVVGHAEVVLPGLGRINQTTKLVAKALPALIEIADSTPKEWFATPANLALTDATPVKRIGHYDSVLKLR